MSTKIINVTADEHGNILVEYNGERVLTTLQLSESLGYSVKSINYRYNSHKDYFVEGEHFYKVSGSEMRIIADAVNKIILDTEQDLHVTNPNEQTATQNLYVTNHCAASGAASMKDSYTQTSGAASGAASMKDSYAQTSGAASGAAVEQTFMRGEKSVPKSRKGYLWTKRGIARLCKMYDSPLTWEVFAALENSYFTKTAPVNPPVTTPVIESAPPPKPYELPDVELSIRERVDILSKCLDYTDSKNLRNKIITDIAYLITRKIY